MTSKEEFFEDYYAKFSGLDNQEGAREYDRITANLLSEENERSASYRRRVGEREDPQLLAMMLEAVELKREALRLALVKLYEEQERPAQERGERQVPLDTAHYVTAATTKFDDTLHTRSRAVGAVKGAVKETVLGVAYLVAMLLLGGVSLFVTGITIEFIFSLPLPPGLRYVGGMFIGLLAGIAALSFGQRVLEGFFKK